MEECKKHAKSEIIGYTFCPECEVIRLRAEIERLKEAVITHTEFNNLNNDKDAYLYAMGQWALGHYNDKPVKEDFGL